MMLASPTTLPGVLIFQTQPHHDARGHFVEIARQDDFDRAIGRSLPFVQDNQTHSVKWVLRGLHYQRPPHAQGKLVRVLQGRVFDVVVDVRQASPTFGQWLGTELNDRDGRMLWVPPGLAHGLLVLSDTADVLYKCTAYHAPLSEQALRWDDAQLAIDWPLPVGAAPILSPRDAQAPGWDEVECFAPGTD